jgi:hypothetical protein
MIVSLQKRLNMTSEKYIIKEDLKLVGIQVKTFPEGTGDMFSYLFKTLPDAASRWRPL